MRSLLIGLATTLAGLLALPASAEPYAYVPNSEGGTISVIDTATDAEARTIRGGRCTYAVAVHRASQRAYFTNACDKQLEVLDTSSNTLLAPLPTNGWSPHAVAVDPNGSRAFVVNVYNGGPDGLAANGEVVILDLSTGSVLAEVPVGYSPGGVVVHPDGNTVYVSSGCIGIGNIHTGDCGYQPGIISAIATTAPYTRTDRTIGRFPSGVAISPDGSKVYVTHSYISDEEQSLLSALDTANLMVRQVSSVGDFARGVVVHPGNGRVYVTGGSFGNIVGSVMAFDGTSLERLMTAAVGLYPAGIDIHPDGSRIYVADVFDNSVSVISALGGKMTATIPVGHRPHAIGRFIQAPAAASNNPIYEITALRGLVVAANLGDTRLRNSLLAPLDAALAWLSGSLPNRVQSACNNLFKFIAVVQQNIQLGTLPAAVGSPWLTEANNIRSQLGCETR